MLDVKIRIGGREFGGWKTVRVTRSIEALAYAFELTLSESWTWDNAPIEVHEGQRCTIYMDHELAVTGYIETSDASYSGESHTLSIGGRSLAGDLVDCSAVHTGSWKNNTLTQIAKDLCRPFGIELILDRINTDIVIPEFTLNLCETVHEALDRACRMCQVLLISNPQGKLIFTAAREHKTRTVLKWGENILNGSRRGNLRDRFKTYTIKTQNKGTNTSYGTHASEASGTATDSAINRYRPMILHAEGTGDRNKLTERANWEKNVRMGRSVRLVYSTPGWKNAEGYLWEPNTVMSVDDPRLRVKGKFLVSQCSLIGDDRGQRTELELTRAEAYTTEPVFERSKSEDLWE